MKWLRMLKGEPMLDGEAPENQEKKAKYRRWGERFCKWTHLDSAAAAIQDFAMRHPKRFFGIIGCVVLMTVLLNIRNACLSYRYCTSAQKTQQSEIIDKRQKLIEIRALRSDTINASTNTNKLKGYESEIN